MILPKGLTIKKIHLLKIKTTKQNTPPLIVTQIERYLMGLQYLFNADTPKANNPGILNGTPNNHTHNEIEITPIPFDLNVTQAPNNTILEGSINSL